MIWPQAQTFGATFRGVDAVTPTGTAPAFALVVDFTGTTEFRFGAPSVAVPVLAVHNVANGSTFKPTIEGVWSAYARFPTNNAGAISLGIGIDLLPAQLNTDPFFVDDRLLDTGSKVGGPPLSVVAMTGPRIITRDIANDPTLGLYRLIASNGAGTNTPVTAASIIAAGCFVTFLRSGPIPAEINN